MSVQLNASNISSRGYYVFTQNTNLVFPNTITLNYLLIGGGGGGGTSHGGGGGAGGVVYKSGISIPSGSYSILVGDGGAVNIKGGDTKFGSFDTAYGGGFGGGAVNGAAIYSNTSIIGSGGGGSGYYTVKVGGITTSGQGFNGGDTVYNDIAGGGGGGGGAGQAGFQNNVNNGGSGGNGTNLYSVILSNIKSVMPSNWQSATSNGYIAGGGGGGTWTNNYAASGGLGGAGSGGTNNGAYINPTAAISNTGSGGGGGGSGGQVGQSGGSGLVVIYIDNPFSTSGNYKVGSYKLKANNIVQTGTTNYNTLSLTGTLNITSKIISNFSVDKVTKAYDGTVNLSNSNITVSTNQFVNNDNVNILSTGVFTDNAFVNTNKPALLTNTISGVDKSNYTLSTSSLNATGSITILDSVTLITTGNWSINTNWSPNVTPILDYVSNAIIPNNLTVTYDYLNLINKIPTCTITNNGSIIFNGTDNYTINNIISGTGSIIKNDSNTVLLSGINTYTNSTTINQGILKIGYIYTLSSSNIIVNSSGTLDLNGYNISNNNINLSGTIANTKENATITISKPISINANSTFNCLGNLNITNSITSNNYSLFLQGGANYNFNNSSNSISSLSANNSTGSIQIVSNVDLTLLNITCNNLNISTTGNIIINGNIIANSIYIKSTNITINTGKSIISSNQLILNATGNFINNSTSTSISSTNSNWVIYSTDPSLNTFGGLNSGNKALWNQVYDSFSIPLFNTYVFKNKGILNITTINSTKVYGEIYDVSTRYTLSGTTQDYSNYFSKNSISDCSTGNLILTSLGSNYTAIVNSYIIEASGITANSSITINFINSGNLTVTKASLVISAVNDTKIYGDLTTSTLNLTYNNQGYVITESIGFSVTGLVTQNDTITNIKLISTGGLSTANVASNYSIIPTINTVSTNVNASNYVITYNNATLNVIKRNFTVSAVESLSNIYKGTSYTSSFTITNAKNNDDTNGNIVVSNLVNKIDVGIYMSNLNVTYTGNYNAPTINNANFIINKANLVANGTEIYNGTNIFSNSNLYINGVNGETFNIQSGTLYLKNNGDIQTNQPLSSLNNIILVGTNTLCKPSNYNDLNISQTTVSVTKAYLTINGSRTYDGTTVIKGSILSCAGVNNQTFPILGNGSSTNLLSPNITNTSSIIQSANYYFKFDGDYNNYGTDSFSCTTYGNVSLTTLGSNNCVTFNNNAYIVSQAFTPTSQFSFCFWVYMPNDSEHHQTISIADANFTSNSSVFQGDIFDNKTFSTAIAIPNFWSVINGPSYIANTWIHLCYTINANASSDANVTLYVNGTYSGSVDKNGGVLGSRSSYHYIFGRAGDQAQRFLNGGGIRNFLAYQNKILTPEEVSQIYNYTGNITYVKLNSFDGLSLGLSTDGGNKDNYYTLTESINNSTISITKADLNLSGTKTYDGLLNINAANCTLSGVNGETFSLTGYGVMQSKNVTLSAINLANISNFIINNGTNPSNYNTLTLNQTNIIVNKANLQIIGSRYYDSTNIISHSILSAVGVNNETYSLLGYSTISSSNVQSNVSLVNLGTLVLSTDNGISNYNSLSIINSSITINAYNLIISGSQTYNGKTILITSNYIAYGVNEEYFLIAGSGNSNNLSNANVGNPVLQNLNGITLSTGFNGAVSTNYNFTTFGASITITKANLTLIGSKIYNNSNTISASNCQLNGVNNESFSLSGYGIMQSKNITNTSITLVDISNFTMNNGVQPSNYNILLLSQTQITVTPKAVNLSLSYTVSKIYDGNSIYTITNNDLTDLSNNLFTGDYIVSIDGLFNDKNIGSSKTITLSNVVINDGNNGNNYSVNYVTKTSNKIEPKSLLITANDSSKYFIDSDITGYSGATYWGFIENENISNLTGSLIINRSNLSNNVPGVYPGVLVPSGYGANNSINGNYQITYSNGTFTIIGADTLSIYIGSESGTGSNVIYKTITTYGTFPSYTIIAKYIDNNGNLYIIPNTDITISNFNNVSIKDGVGGFITFKINPSVLSLSTSNNYNVNNYTLIASDINTTNSSVYNNIYLTGTLIVNKLDINSSQLGVSSINKVYDGNINIITSMLTIVSPGFITNDVVKVNISSGSFDNINVGNNKSISIITYLSDTDSNNYNLILNTLSANIGYITSLSNNTLLNSGNWSDSTNWVGNAIPILGNVINSIIPNNLSVIYDYLNLINIIPTCTITNNGILNLNGSTNFNIGNIISGTGSLIKDGTNTIQITGNNTYTNSITINQGIIKIGNNNALSSSNIIVNSSGTLDLNGYNISNNNINLSGTIANTKENATITISKPITFSANSTFNCIGNLNITNSITSNNYSLFLQGGANYNFNNSSNSISSLRANNSTGSIQIVSNVDLTLLDITCNNLNISTTGNIIINGNITANSIYIKSANITINAGKSIISSNQLILNASGNFINNSTSTSISSTNSNWVIYSTDPSLNTFGGLNSGNKAIWGKTYSTIDNYNKKTYVFSITGILNITTTNLSKIYGTTLNNISIYYALSGNTQDASTYSNLFSNLILSDCSTGSLTISSWGTDATSPIGEYIVYSSGLTPLDGYNINYINTGKITVNKANLNITASNQNTTFGTSLTLDNSKYTCSDLYNSDTITSIVLKQDNNTIIPASQNAGIYSGSNNGIIASNAIGNGLNNYSITYYPGTLTINPANLSITASNQTTIYGTSLYLGINNFTSIGLVNNNIIQSVTLTQNNSAYTSKKLSVGVYSNSTNGITPSNPIGIIASNYNITYNIGTLTITQAALSYLATSITLERDTLNNPISVSGTVIGFVNNDTISNSTIGTLLFSTTANSSSAIGQYPIVGSGLSSTNYTITNASTNNTALTLVQAGTPTISLISPIYGTISGNTPVTIYGNNFASTCTVSFGSISSTNVTYIGTSCIKAISPVGTQGSVNIIITNKGVSSTNTESSVFNYYTVPGKPLNINAIAGNTNATITWNPPTNNGGSVITNYKITSYPENIIIYSTTTSVKINGLTNNTNYYFKVSAQNIIGYGNDSDNSNEIIPYPTPIISSILPNFSALSGGETITITGNNFYNVSNILFGSINILSYNINSSTELTFTIPSYSQAGSIDTSITATGGTITNTNGFTYYSQPNISSISPLTGSCVGGTTVTITGSNFLSTTSVKIGDYSTNIINITNDTITLTTVSYIITDNIILSLPVIITTLGGITSYNYFTYILPQKLSSSLLNSPTSLYIFGNNISDSSVSIDGNSADYVSNVSTSEIIVTYNGVFSNGATISILNTGIESSFILDTSNPIQNYYGSSLSSFSTE